MIMMMMGMQTTVSIVLWVCIVLSVTCIIGDVCAIPHWVTRVDPMTVVVGPLPPRELEACLIASGPMLVLHVTSAAFPRAASRMTAIETILLATPYANGAPSTGPPYPDSAWYLEEPYP